MAGLGEDLRAAREARNLTLSDISERIHIRTIYLQSLEAEDWGAIDAPVYVRGFLRTYARFLGLDPEESVARFNAALPVGAVASAPSSTAPSLRTAPRRGPSLWLLLGAAIAAVLVLFVAYNFIKLQQDQGTVGSVEQAAAPAGSPSAAPSSVPAPQAAGRPTSLAGANGLGLRFVGRSWVHVDVDGAVAMDGIYPAGTEKVFHGKEATVRVGNAAGVQLTVDGRNLGALGPSGAVVERSFKLAQE
jgi:transcriptional regulator with XRE-family HTH domain